MTTILISIVGFFLIIQCSSSPTNNITTEKSISEHTKNDTTKDQFAETIISKNQNDLEYTFNHQNITTQVSNKTNVTDMEDKDVIIINLEEINKMSPVEFIGRKLRSLWDYILHGNKEEKKSSFIGRCARIAKKIGQLIPIITIGGGIMMTKLAFLVLFSLKTIGLLIAILVLNVGTAAAKLGALLASKKSEHSPQNLHFHVLPSKSDDHIYSSSHLSGPPYGFWDDRIDTNIEKHDLYNLYEKLKMENDLRKYFSRTK